MKPRKNSAASIRQRLLRSCPEINYAFKAHLYPTFERSSLENARNTPVCLRIFSLRTSKFRANLSVKCTVYFWTAPKHSKRAKDRIPIDSYSIFSREVSLLSISVQIFQRFCAQRRHVVSGLGRRNAPTHKGSRPSKFR
jgi:hypothetical protein